MVKMEVKVTHYKKFPFQRVGILQEIWKVFNEHYVSQLFFLVRWWSVQTEDVEVDVLKC